MMMTTTMKATPSATPAVTLGRRSVRVGRGVGAVSARRPREAVSVRASARRDEGRRVVGSAAATTTTTTRGRGESVVASAMSGGYGGGGRGFNIVPVPDRVVALVPYLLPLMSALRYGRFFFTQFPAAVILLKPLMPILRGVATLPMGNLIVFFAIYLGIAKNQNLSRFCRFNAMQAILLDIALIFPSLVESLFGPGILGIGLPYGVTMVMHNAIFVVTLGAFALAAVGCMTGQYVRLKFLADAADAQMGAY
jgi:hypothetical protein